MRRARLEGANLSEARLEGANLRGARLEGANLCRARLEGANLALADLRRSNWAGASNRASPAQFADFRGAQGLTQAQLEDLIGNAGTLLARRHAPDTGEPFYVWSCWEKPPPDLDRIVATAAGLLRRSTRTAPPCAPSSSAARTTRAARPAPRSPSTPPTRRATRSPTASEPAR